MVAVEGSDVLVELGVRLRRFRQQHRRRVADVPAAPDEELERVVEQRRVRALEVEPVPAGPHPRDVAVDGVDLAVVAEQAEGLRPLPGRRGVRGEALVEDAERDGERGIEQIRIERGELVGRAESLVRDGAERERRDIRAGRLLGSRARPVSAPLGLVQARSEWTLQDELLDSRHRGARHRRPRSRSAQPRRVGRPWRDRTTAPARACAAAAGARLRRRRSAGRPRLRRGGASARAPRGSRPRSRVTRCPAHRRGSRCRRNRAHGGGCRLATALGAPFSRVWTLRLLLRPSRRRRRNETPASA